MSRSTSRRIPSLVPRAVVVGVSLVGGLYAVGRAERAGDTGQALALVGFVVGMVVWQAGFLRWCRLVALSRHRGVVVALPVPAGLALVLLPAAEPVVASTALAVGCGVAFAAVLVPLGVADPPVPRRRQR